MIVKINYVAHKKIERAVFGIGIHRDDGIHIAGPNVKADKFIKFCIKGQGAIEYIIDPLPLLGGKYLLSASVYDYEIEHPYDHHDRIYKFQITKPKPEENYGLLRFKGRWIYKRN